MVYFSYKEVSVYAHWHDGGIKSSQGYFLFRGTAVVALKWDWLQHTKVFCLSVFKSTSCHIEFKIIGSAAKLYNTFILFLSHVQNSSTYL